MKRSALNKRIDGKTIERLKNDTRLLSSFLQSQNDSAVVYLLEKLGRLKNGRNKLPLLNLLDSDNEKIRRLAVKNLAKIGDASLLKTFADFAARDTSAEVRRESVSAIGRLRDKKAIPVLIKLTSDKNPEIVMQALRALLVFSSGSRVKKAMVKLTGHPNELVKEFVAKEINGISPIPKKSGHDGSADLLKNTVVRGDAARTLDFVADGSVHLTFTSPPYYNARDYSTYQSYNQYLKFLERVFKQVHRITKEGRFFILNTSPIIVPRISRAHSSRRYPIPYDIHPLLTGMGWQFIDDIVWVKPEASVKNRNAGFFQHRKPLAYKPNAATEMLMVYRKKTDKLIDWNIRQYGADKVKRSRVLGKYETTNVWHIDPSFDKVHSAVFPLELCERVIKYYSFAGDLVFDPFAGSGTLARAAARLGRYFFLAEKEKRYVERIKKDLIKTPDLFDSNICPVKFFDVKEFASAVKKS